jgi:AcrR family transcriptional regulator
VTARRATPAQRRALANYHFGSKQGLLEAVFLRRAGDLDSERLARLDAAIAGAPGQPPRLEEIIGAFTHPLLDSVHERLVPFCAAGFRALCARQKTKR